MPLRITMLAYPTFLLLMALNARGGAGLSRLVEARAFSAETARRPESVGIKGGRESLARAIRAGVVVELGDGRYYVDPAPFMRRRRRMRMAFAGVAIVGAGIVLALWAPWRT